LGPNKGISLFEASKGVGRKAVKTRLYEVKGKNKINTQKNIYPFALVPVTSFSKVD
jgi:hypothetical protein